MRKLFSVIVTMILLCGNHRAVHAQYFQRTLFDASPTTLNPSYIGFIDGDIRAVATCRFANEGETAAYRAWSGAVDAPLLNLPNGDCIAAGAQADQISYTLGGTQNFIGTAGLAYQKRLGSDRARRHGRATQLSFGVQAGYKQLTVNQPELYFDNSIFSTNYTTVLPPSGSGYTLGIGNTVNYYTLNAGLAFSHAPGRKFNYVIGAAVQNINQPTDALLKAQVDYVGVDRLYVGTAGCNLLLPRGFSLHPAGVFQYQGDEFNLIAGSELAYLVLKGRREISVMGGCWYRNEDALMATAGVSYGGFKLRAGLDFDMGPTPTSADTGFELALSYIRPGKYLRKRRIPCDRF